MTEFSTAQVTFASFHQRVAGPCSTGMKAKQLNGYFFGCTLVSLRWVAMKKIVTATALRVSGY